MGRHSSTSRALVPAIDYAAISAAVDAAGAGGDGINLMLETQSDTVTVDGILPLMTGITAGPAVYGIGGTGAQYASQNLGGVRIDSSHYLVWPDGSVKKHMLNESSTTGGVTLTQLAQFQISDTLISHNLSGTTSPQGITSDGTHLYIINTLNYIQKFETDGTFVSQFDFSTLVPGFVGGHVYTGSDDNLKINTAATAITCDGTNLFVRTVYSLADETLVGAVIFKFTLDGTLIRNIIEDTDYHIILDAGSRYSDSSVATNRATCSSYNSGTMTINNNHVWMRFTSIQRNYAVTSYGLDFVYGDNDVSIGNVVSNWSDSSSNAQSSSAGGLVFTPNNDVVQMGVYATRLVISYTNDVIKITAPSIGLLVEVGDTVIVNSVEAVVSLIENENIVHTTTDISASILTNAIVVRKRVLFDSITLVKLLPLTYALRT